jgi:LmbE family N-acetylglucosaminyl deacetylase
MALVAHPDDCVIFAYSYIHNHPEYEWTVCYLTYNEQDPRGQEFSDFWRRRGVQVKFLNHPDHWNTEKNCPGEIDFDTARRDIEQVVADQDLVLTHNADGEYGHPHHKLVHQASQNHPCRVLFAKFGDGNERYTIEPGVYSLDEFPLHRDIVSTFHTKLHVNEYTK